MPTILKKVEDYESTGARHHGGGIMSKGGFDVEEAEVSVAEYARRLVEEASMHVAYRKWIPMEMLNIGQDMKFYIFCHRDMSLALVRVGLLEFPITGNEWWRKDARKWIEENYQESDTDDQADARRENRFGAGL